jgi:hypothetical protein
MWRIAWPTCCEALGFAAFETVGSAYLDVDGGFERRLLCVVALEAYAMLLVPDAVGGHGRVMTEHLALASAAHAYRMAPVPDLLANELCLTSLILPLAQEQFAQERVQRLLLAT